MSEAKYGLSTSEKLKDNPWGATTMRDLRLYQFGCFLVFAHTLAGIALVVIVIGNEEGWW